MKILGGRYKGIKILSKSSKDLRPTTDRSKEWIFQIIDEYIEGSVFMDLFAGSGNLGIEALSRGCLFSLFIDKFNTDLIYKNCRNIIAGNNYRIIKSDVVRFLKRRHKPETAFRIISADPPYDYDRHGELVRIILESRLLENGGLFILESGKHNRPDFDSEELEILKEKQFGDTTLTIYRKEKN
ncbi:MAG: 16S rRNA (guanine(966)-N(2))-methyltransferase RsmD [bacterium]|nr:16S rRNA (guanine(966)-N(2))-methyltransferase RsmD [bacterium]